MSEKVATSGPSKDVESPDADLMLGHCLRHWPNINPAISCLLGKISLRMSTDDRLAPSRKRRFVGDVGWGGYDPFFDRTNTSVTDLQSRKAQKKAKRQYLLTCKVSRYCILALNVSGPITWLPYICWVLPRLLTQMLNNIQCHVQRPQGLLETHREPWQHNYDTWLYIRPV